MAPNAVELIKRAFASFETIAKRDPRTPGAVEVDLGKVATEIAKAASTFGVAGDVDALERSIDELGALLEKSTYDSTTDRVYSPATELAKRVAVGKAESAPQYTHEGGAPTPPAKGSKEQKANQYTAEGGLATETGEQYTETASATVATTPSGAPAIGFDQPAGGPAAKAAKAATAKAAAPAKTTGSVAGPAAADAEGGEPAISEGKQGRRAAKRAQTAKAAGPVTTEELWARDMAVMTGAEIAEVRKAAKKQAEAPEDGEEEEVEKDCLGGGETAPASTTDEDADDRSAPDAKAKAKAKKAAMAKKKNAEGGLAAGADDVNEPEDDETEKAADDDEDAAEDAEDGGADEEAEGEKPFPPKKGKTAKAAGETDWPGDLSPATSPVDKSARLTAREVAAKANGSKAISKRAAEIRKEALSIEEVPGDTLTPDQVTELQKSAKLTPGQRRRENAKRLKNKGYVAGTREIEVDGIDEAAIASDDGE